MAASIPARGPERRQRRILLMHELVHLSIQEVLSAGPVRGDRPGNGAGSPRSGRRVAGLSRRHGVRTIER